MKKLAIISTHPIQYYAPLFQLLASGKNTEIKVFYTWGDKAKGKIFDPGFGKEREWDIPLLDGYEHEFVTNISSNPGSHHFNGIINPGLISRIKLYQPDAILVFGWNFQSHLKVMRYFKGKIPVLFRGDSTLLDRQSILKKKIRTIFLTWVYKHIDYALYVGTNNKDYFIQSGIKPKQLFFAPHAIDNKRFNDIDGIYQEKAGKMREALKISRDAVIFLFAGKMEPKKDPEILIKAFLAVNNPGAHLIIVGNGYLEKVLKESYSEVQNLHFMDFQNQSAMPVIYYAADIFVLPSVGPGETWGLAINEAMACKRAILASTKVGCAIDLVAEGKNGYIFEAGNIDSLIEKMDFFLQNKKKLWEMGEWSSNKIQHWDISVLVGSIQTILKNNLFNPGNK